jgi:hypothetical protein
LPHIRLLDVVVPVEDLATLVDNRKACDVGVIKNEIVDVISD